jgi:hypothetical protein
VTEPRCSSTSLALDEPLSGTASVVWSWVLLEQPGPWGPNAVVQSRMPRPVARWLRATSAELGVRVVLLRRPGETAGPRRHVFLAYTGQRERWVEHAHLPDPRALLDVDLSALVSGDPVGLGPREELPLYLVCTNGRRDPCCAELGRPLARAMAAVAADRVWECSHIGGDRFAGNVVCFPHGAYLGRVRPHQAAAVVADYDAGLIDLDHYRGRSCYDFATQAAEDFIRRLHGLRGIDDLAPTDRAETPRGTITVEFSGPSGTTHRVRVHSSHAEVPRTLTCHADRASRPKTFEVLGSD